MKKPIERRTYTIPVPETADVYETIKKWFKKNRYKIEHKTTVSGLCEKDYFHKNGYRYFVGSQIFDGENVEFEIVRG